MPVSADLANGVSGSLRPFAACPTLVAGSRRWPPLRLAELAHARGRSLERQGLAAGQVVLCPDAPTLDVVLMVCALGRIGAALFPYRAGSSRGGLSALAASAGAEWSWCPRSGKLAATGIGSAPPPHPALALLVQTSGSTAAPRIVMLTAQSLAASAAAVNRRLALGTGDVWLCCLRLSHIGGLAILYRCASAGATLVLHERFDAAVVAEDLRRHAVTHVSLVPPMLDRLLNSGATPPATLRVVLVGGQALSPALCQRALAAGWPLFLTYGMTETASAVAVSTRALRRVPAEGVVGPLLEGVQAELIEAGPRVGRLRIRGPVVMAGYANPRRIPGGGLAGGWLETSDLGWVAQDGTLTVTGRDDDVLVIGGSNVSLAHVETRLRAAPGVADVAVVGLDDPVWGHRLVAVYCGDWDEASLRAWCERTFPGPDRPRTVRRVRALPLLDSGKHDRGALRALAQGRAAV